MRAWIQPDDTIGMLDVVVHPDQQRSGIGGAWPRGPRRTAPLWG
jgi:hypothetical protein